MKLRWNWCVAHFFALQEYFLGPVQFEKNYQSFHAVNYYANGPGHLKPNAADPESLNRATGKGRRSQVAALNTHLEGGQHGPPSSFDWVHEPRKLHTSGGSSLFILSRLAAGDNPLSLRSWNGVSQVTELSQATL